MRKPCQVEEDACGDFSSVLYFVKNQMWLVVLNVCMFCRWQYRKSEHMCTSYLLFWDLCAKCLGPLVTCSTNFQWHVHLATETD